MEKGNDFYLDERWLAAYFEKDWSDHVFKSSPNDSIQFEYPKFDSSQLYSKYHQEFVDFISIEISKYYGKPESLLEIGSSLGRTFYELCIRQPSLKVATLIEPSQYLASSFSKIFKGENASKCSMLLGNRDLQNVEFNCQHIRSACKKVDFSVVNSEFQDIDSSKSYDLVVCSNVIDQCRDPLALVELLKRSTKKSGFLALSCTYQWNDKYIEPSMQNITNVTTLFGNDWKLLSEKDIEFKCRRSERHWMTFLSHAVVLQKNG